MKIAIMGMGNVSVAAAAIIEQAKLTHPEIEIVYVDQASGENLSKLEGGEFENIWFDVFSKNPLKIPHSQFECNYDGISRKGKGERKRNKANRWR